MTLQEVRDNFVARYKLVTQGKDAPIMQLDDKLIADLISEAQQDIQRRLQVVELNKLINLVNGTNSYSLPTNFGSDKLVLLSDTVSGISKLEASSSNEIYNQIALSDTPTKYAILESGFTQNIILYPTPKDSTQSITVYYYPDTNYFSPSGASSQDWGNFDGNLFSGNLKLPERYYKAIIFYMLAQIIPPIIGYRRMLINEYQNKYDEELRSLRGSRVSSMSDTINFNIGGISG